MKNYILKTILGFAIILTPIITKAAPVDNKLSDVTDYPTSLNDNNDAYITVQGYKVRITNAQGEELIVFDITGKKIASFHIDSNDKTILLKLRKGCYLLKVNKTTRKVLFS